MANASSIVVDGLSKTFSGETVVHPIAFEVAACEIFGLVGPDGAGKSTTLRMLAGVLRADSGTVTVAGHDVVRAPDDARGIISYMPQRFALYQELTVDENIRFYADLFGVTHRQRQDRSDRLLRAAGLAPFRGRLAGALSGGMKQKLGLVCALVHTPKALLLDEPTNGVDPVSRREFWRILYSLTSEGVAVVISTAYLDEAERCHRVAMLHKGRLLRCDTPDRLKRAIAGTVVAAVAHDGRAVREALAAAPGVHAAVLVGDGVHLFVDDSRRRVPELRARLEGAGIGFDELAPAEPTIEDVFVAALEQRGQSV